MMKRMMVLIFISAIVITHGVSFITTSESTPSVVILEKSSELEMSRLENNWWRTETTLEPGMYHYYFSTEESTLTAESDRGNQSEGENRLFLLFVEDFGELQNSVIHDFGNRDYFNPVNEKE
ncbi:MAG: glycoside hydrolase family 13 protein, partial [Mesotoga sp.]|nr:glycoside hydrolase family 13 protein [Mesotoga sp.]